MRGVVDVQVPAVELIVVLRERKGAGQGVDFSLGSGVGDIGTQANNDLQSRMQQRIRRSIGGEIAQCRKRNPCSLCERRRRCLRIREALRR